MTHDACRGEGNFAKAIRGINILQKHKIPLTVRVTIHKYNVHDLDNVANLLLEEIGLPSFSTNAASYMGLCRQNSGQVQLTAEERSLAMETLLRLNQEYNGRIGASAGPLAEGRMWLEMERARQERLESLPNRGYLTSCGGVFSKMAVRPDGAIVPCLQMSHIELGWINEDDLGEVWREHPDMNRMRERRNIPLSDFEFCRGCDYVNYCSGGCPALAYNIVGDEYHPSPDSCLRVFLEEGGRLPDMALLPISGR
jgi:SynChlorMet cassette radical SAM/SPASM protein ScmE